MTKKRNRSSDILQRKQMKRSLKTARNSTTRRLRVEARTATAKAEIMAKFEELKSTMIKDWEKKFNKGNGN